MLSVVPVGPLIAGHPALQTLHLVVSNAERYNMFRITNMKFPGRKAFGGFGSGVSHVTKRRHLTGMGLPPTTDIDGVQQDRLMIGLARLLLVVTLRTD